MSLPRGALELCSSANVTIPHTFMAAKHFLVPVQDEERAVVRNVVDRHAAQGRGLGLGAAIRDSVRCVPVFRSPRRAGQHPGEPTETRACLRRSRKASAAPWTGPAGVVRLIRGSIQTEWRIGFPPGAGSTPAGLQWFIYRVFLTAFLVDNHSRRPCRQSGQRHTRCLESRLLNYSVGAPPPRIKSEE